MKIGTGLHHSNRVILFIILPSRWRKFEADIIDGYTGHIDFGDIVTAQALFASQIEIIVTMQEWGIGASDGWIETHHGSSDSIRGDRVPTGDQYTGFYGFETSSGYFTTFG